jgi:YggT family protein
MLNQIGSLVVEATIGLLVYLGLLRFYMQALRAPFRNPIGQFVITFSDWGIQPLRKIVPGWRGWDFASLVFAFLVQWLMVFLIFVALMPTGAPTIGMGSSIIYALFEIARKSLHLLVVVVLADVIISWINPQSPFAPFLQSITRPLYSVFRRFIPPIGGFDLSPLFLILVVQIGFILLNGLQNAVWALR